MATKTGAPMIDLVPPMLDKNSFVNVVDTGANPQFGTIKPVAAPRRSIGPTDEEMIAADHAKPQVDVWNAIDIGMQLSNPYYKLMATGERPDFRPKDGWEPPDQEIKSFIQSPEEADVLYSTTSPEDYNYARTEIIRDRKLREDFARSGWAGKLSMLYGGIVDPAYVPAVMAGGGVLKTIATFSAATAGSEALMHQIDKARTVEESLQNVVGTAVVVGVLGTALKLVTKPEVESMGRALGRKLTPAKETTRIPIEEPSPVLSPEAPNGVATSIPTPLSREAPGGSGAVPPVSEGAPGGPGAVPPVSGANVPDGMFIGKFDKNKALDDAVKRLKSGDTGPVSGVENVVEVPPMSWDEAINKASLESAPPPAKDSPTWAAWEDAINARAKAIFEEANNVPKVGEDVATVPAQPVKNLADERLAITLHADTKVADISKQFQGAREPIASRMRYLMKDLDEATTAKIYETIDPIFTKDPNWNLAVLESAVERMKPKIESLESLAAESKPRSLFKPFSSIGEMGAETQLVKLLDSLPLDVPIPMSKLLNNIAENATSAAVRTLVKILQRLELDSPVILKSEYHAPGSYRTKISPVTGKTEAIGREIIIRVDERSDDFVRTFLHEAVHSATTHAMATSNPFYQTVKSLWQHARELANKEGITNFESGTHYGLKNVEEFVAEIFTNPRFQQWAKTQRGVEASVWQKFKDALAKYFNKESLATDNLFDQAMDASEPLFKTEAEILAYGPRQLESRLAEYNQRRIARGDKPIPQKLETQEQPLPDSTPATTEPIEEGSKLDVPYRAGKVLSVGMPQVRLATSPLHDSRDIGSRLMTNPVRQVQNSYGVKSVQSVEDMVKLYNGPLGETVTAMHDLYAKMVGVTGPAKFFRSWAKGKVGQAEMDWLQFKDEVGKAITSGIPHSNPAIQQAADLWTKKIFDPLMKEGISSELLDKVYKHPKRGNILFAMYDYTKLTADSSFQDGITNWLINSRLEPNPVLARAAANRVREDVLASTFSAGVPQEVMVRLPSTFGARQTAMNVPVPREMLAPWMINDVELMGRRFSRRMAFEIELYKQFGSSDLGKEFAAIEKGYEKLAAAPGADTEMLRKRKMQDIRDLRSMLAVFRGTYGLPTDPSSVLVRGARAFRTWQYVTSLGAQMLSATPDLARPIMTNGVLPYFRSFTRFVATRPKMAIADINEMGQAYEMVLHNRVSVMADVLDNPGVYGKAERISDSIAGTYGKVTIMDPWNQFWKEFVSVQSSNRILRMSDKGWENLSKAEQSQLAWLGIDSRDLGLIKSQVRKHGEIDNGFLVGNIHKWGESTNELVREEGMYARRTLSAAVNKEADTLIVTPGKGDKPLFAHTEAGKTTTQFMAFMFAANNRMLLSGLAQRDLNVINSVVGGAMMGALAIYIKRSLSGAPMPSNPLDWANQSVNQAGNLGIWSEGITVGADLMGHGIQHKSIKEVLSERIIGASLSTMVNVGTVGTGLAGAATGGKWKEHQTRAARSLVPYQNLFYTRKVFDAAEYGINKGVNAQPSRKRSQEGGAHAMGTF